MGLPTELAYASLLFVAVVATAILTSRTVIEKLVSLGIFPQIFINFVPVMTLAARALAIVLIFVGAVELGITTGALSREWLARYGFSSLLILLGGFLLFLTARRPRKD
jgi:hypothetical protein